MKGTIAFRRSIYQFKRDFRDDIIMDLFSFVYSGAKVEKIAVSEETEFCRQKGGNQSGNRKMRSFLGSKC